MAPVCHALAHTRTCARVHMCSDLHNPVHNIHMCCHGTYLLRAMCSGTVFGQVDIDTMDRRDARHARCAWMRRVAPVNGGVYRHWLHESTLHVHYYVLLRAMVNMVCVLFHSITYQRARLCDRMCDRRYEFL